ncbi:PDZ domain-containing protein [Lentilactobacillus farraginis]|uniref:Cell division topological determinant MinJ n=1 Tax=Lentilactobacillus farraginis DSM 18382 = JCM 14108 TaxID=1423743 RepID=X0PLL2_9LACO|nr:PDZ domain-containing protein [Lentilactobacillus farraginis]GAF37646.1 cell division topological determinant MinJ [Lentilactobacillus farraginis DSM 18382 = JCM 14108]
MKFLLAICFYVLQPILWVGIIRAFLIHTNRVKRERQIFNSAIYEEFYEGRHFIRSGLIMGIIFSLVCGFLVTVSGQWLLIYEGLCLIGVMLVPWQILGVTAAGLAGIIALLIPKSFPGQPMTGWSSKLGLTNQPTASVNYLLVLVLIIFMTGLFIRANGGRFDSPAISRNKRNNKVAVYPFNELTIMPFLMLLPGDWFKSGFSFIPLFQLNGHSFAVLLVPVLIGLKLTVRKSNPREFFKNLGKLMLVVAGIGVLMVVGVMINHALALPAMLCLMICYYGVVVITKRRDLKQSFEYSEVMDGIRVIGIRPGTPAAKMNLSVGDVILTVNDIQVTNEDQFYRALSTSPTYCRFKVRDRNDQLKMTESAIFKNSPHEIGVKTYSQSIK